MAKPLQEYQRKRDFNATPEPAGKRARPRSAHALQYCIQKHDASHLHYDFRLELDGTLKSWAIPKGPSLDPKVRRLAVHVEDHPLDYANFEGRIPEGHYGAGDVIVWDRGVWEPEGDPREAYAKGKLRFRLQGEKLSGVWNLFRTHLAGKKEQWMLVKSHDGQARSETDYSIVEALPDSVLSERTLPPRSPGKATTVRHKRKTDPKALPDALQPQLATLVASPPSGDWRYEVKFDGYRILARIDGDDIRLFTRNGHDWSAKMPRQVEALKALGLDSAWLDGEMVVVDDNGVADFQALQNAFDTEHDERITYYLFDLPWLGGEDLRALPLQQRRATLARLLEGHASQVIRYSADFEEPVASLLDSACRLELEGLIGKRADSPYVGRRSSDWVKLKCKQRQEFVIVGYTDPKGSRNGFGALLLALHDHGSGPLRYAGKVGTGFSAATLDSIHARLKPLQTDKSPLPKPPTGAEARGVHWLKPQLLAEVAYAQMTREGIVRHSVFHGLRDDKPATAIDLERAMPTKRAVQTEPENLGTLRLTHPDRVVDATTGATKREVAQYYAQVADWLLPQLKDRPVALVRAPDGLDGELFFQKNAGQLHIPKVLSYSKAQAGQAAMVLNRADSLLGAVQMNTLELHTWNATTKDFDKPDRFVLDLDPDPALPWKAMLEATQLTLTLLDELGLKVFLKTSGGKGMHLVVPLTRRTGWDEVKDFSHALVNHMAGLFPDRLSAVSGPKNRVGRIFIDYLRNGKGATTVAAYSLRAREGLPVSVPIWREELSQLKGANQWNIGNLHTRLAQVEDPWAEMGKTRQSITLRMRKQLGIA
ncbi:DNA ligase D [Pseudomonas monteilii]|uniref:DNA ligase D n=1 Tax=Pseudomonas TaxID=286 RepID=UPI00048AA25C|nr:MULTISPECIES: DNA ligase D [Pseudomonas]MBA1314939.1 DNA ligase D [Pseudomonas monteilii]MCE1017060.1 DNA ligase D [Pseudomonas monteilii]MCE1033639.1 DNA ligase D [Pseudomonas monteilii]MCE1085467.1 DNA ligase D [Pseudomonas monteilii]MDH0021053.1 DNA ligase D [Pseudomonas monteilii]